MSETQSAGFEAAVLRICREYGVARLRFDRMQAEQLIGNVRRAGVPVREYVFSAAGAARLARGLHVAFCDRGRSRIGPDSILAPYAPARLAESWPNSRKQREQTLAMRAARLWFMAPGSANDPGRNKRV